MNINFGKWQEEVIYNDHGGHYPCRTDYLTTFTIGGVRFYAAVFSDTNRNIYVYHNNHHVVTIYTDNKLTTDKAEELIKAEFNKESYSKIYAKEKQRDQLNNLKESLYQKLLAEAGD